MFERCLYFNINALTRRINKLWEQAFKELGLAPSHAYLLRLILSQPGLSQKAITQELKLEKSTVTRFISKLEKEGYLIRKADVTSDRRELNIFPTKKSQKIHDRLETIGQELYQSMLENIGQEALPKFVSQLRKNEHNLK